MAATLKFDSSLNPDGFVRGVNEMQRSLGSFLKQAAGLAGISVSIYGVKEFVKNVSDMRAYFQDIESSMKVFLGNSEKGAEFTKKLKDYAYYNMFEFKDLAKASQEMIAYNHSVDSIIPRLDQLSNVATGTHGSLMELVAAYNRAKSTGVVDARGIQSWAVKGVMIRDELKAMGDTAVGTSVSFEQLNKVLDKVTGEGGRFHNLMGEMMQNISAEIGQFQDNLDSKLNEIGERYQDIIVSGIKLGEEVVDALDEIDGGLIDTGFKAAGETIEYLRENFKELAAIIRDGVAALGIYKAALVATNVAEGVYVAWKNKEIISTGTATAATIADTLAMNNNTASKSANAVATKILTVAQEALNVAMLKNPWALAALAIGTVAFAIYKNVTAISAEEAAEKDLADTMDGLEEKYKAYNEETEKAISLAKDDSQATGERAKAIDFLNNRYPGLIENYVNEKGLLTDIEKLKERIAELDKQGQRTETLDVFQKQNKDIDAYLKYIEDKKKNPSLALTDEDMELFSRIRGMMDRVGFRGDINEQATFLNKVREQNNEQINNLNNQYKYEDFVNNGVLGEMSTSDLTALKDRLVNATWWNDRIYVGQADAYFDKTQTNNIISDIEGILKARNRERTGAEKTFAEVTKDFVDKTRDLERAQANMKAGLETYVKQVGDEWKVVKKGTEGAVLMENAEFEKIQQAADNASKAFKNMGGDPKMLSEAKKLNAARIQEERKHQEEMEQLQKKAEDERTDAKIASIKNDGKREEAQREEQHRRTIRDLKEQEEDIYKTIYEQRKKEWEKKNKDTPYENTAQGSLYGAKDMAGTLTEEEKEYYNKRMEVIYASIDKEDVAYSQWLDEKLKKDMEYMDAYLSKYGDFESRKEAIIREYDRRIAESSGNPYEVASMNRERENAISGLRMTELKNAIDWEGIFNNLDSYSTEFLQEIRDNLSEALKDPSLNVEDRKVLSDKIHDIDERIRYETEGLFHFVGEQTMQHKRLVEEAAEAQKRYDEALEEEMIAKDEVSEGKNVIKAMFATYGENVGDVDFKDKGKLVQRFGNLGGNTSLLIKAFDKLGASEANLADKTAKATKAEGEAAAAKDKATEDFDEKVASRLSDLANWTNKYLGDLPDLLDKVGLGGAGEKVQLGINAVNSAAGAAADLASHNYIGAASKAFDAIGNIGEILGIGGSSDKTLHDDIERLTNSNEALTKAVSNLAGIMEKSPILAAPDIYDEQIRDIKNAERNTREMMQRSGAAYSTGWWGTGIGGHSSSNYNINENMTTSEWARISNALGINVRSATDFFKLTSEQMWKVSTYLPDIYAKIKQYANEGYEDAAQFMDDYISYWQQLEDIETNYYETMTSMTFDNVLSDFTSKLMDMDSEAKDFSENFEQYLQNAILQAMLIDQYKPMLETWYKAFAHLMENGLTPEEREMLKNGGWYTDENDYQVGFNGWDQIVDNAVNARNALKEAWGFGQDSFSQSASAKAWGSMSQDMGEELNGRFTALQMAGESINTNVTIMMANLKAMQELTSSSNGTLIEIRNLQIIANGHLEDIAKYTKPLLEFGGKLDKLIENTK